MKYLLLSLSFFLFLGNAQAQDVAKAKCNTDYVSSILDVTLDYFSGKSAKTTCTPAPTCAKSIANVQQVANQSTNCKPANCKPENCPPGCKPGSPECKLAVASTQVASAETKPTKAE